MTSGGTNVLVLTRLAEVDAFRAACLAIATTGTAADEQFNILRSRAEDLDARELYRDAELLYRVLARLAELRWGLAEGEIFHRRARDCRLAGKQEELRDGLADVVAASLVVAEQVEGLNAAVVAELRGGFGTIRSELEGLRIVSRIGFERVSREVRAGSQRVTFEVRLGAVAVRQEVRVGSHRVASEVRAGAEAVGRDVRAAGQAVASEVRLGAAAQVQAVEAGFESALEEGKRLRQDLAGGDFSGGLLRGFFRRGVRRFGFGSLLGKKEK